MTDDLGARVRQEIDKYLDEHDLKLIRMPIHDEMERRAICLRLAIETKGWITFDKKDGSEPSAEAQIVQAAAEFERYVSGSRE